MFDEIKFNENIESGEFLKPVQLGSKIYRTGKGSKEVTFNWMCVGKYKDGDTIYYKFLSDKLLINGTLTSLTNVKENAISWKDASFAENYVKEMNTLNIDVDYELDIPSLRDVEDLVPPKRVAYFGDYNRCCESYWAKNSGKLLREGHVGSCVAGEGYPSRYDSTKVLAVRPAIWLTMNTYWEVTAR